MPPLLSSRMLISGMQRTRCWERSFVMRARRAFAAIVFLCRSLCLSTFLKVDGDPAHEKNEGRERLIRKSVIRTMEKIAADATSKGAVVELGGTALEDKGYFFSLTLRPNVMKDTMMCFQEKFFGPILPLVSFRERRRKRFDGLTPSERV